MNWKSTWILLGLATGLFAFIFLFERRLPTTDTPPARLFSFKASQITNIQLRVTNHLMLRVERTRAGAIWNYSFPISYPAKVPAVEWLIQSLEEAVPLTLISKLVLASSPSSATPAIRARNSGGRRLTMNGSTLAPKE